MADRRRSAAPGQPGLRAVAAARAGEPDDGTAIDNETLEPHRLLYAAAADDWQHARPRFPDVNRTKLARLTMPTLDGMHPRASRAHGTADGD